MSAPLIGITASNQADAQPYRQWVESQGATCKLLLPKDAAQAKTSLQDLDGLLLSGGPDIDPVRYSQLPSPEAGPSCPQRDDLEFRLLQCALERDLPVLGICRGMQLLNVALGGSLVQNLPGHRIEGRGGGGESALHQIYLSPGSRLGAVLGTGGFFRVNSRHHQGLFEAQRAPGLLASAYALSDGLIEALEAPGKRWCIGLQCHPEREEENPKGFRRLLQSFMEHASGG